MCFRLYHAENENGSVVVDLSVSETKPLTSYGSGEDEEEGSGEEYDQYKETDDVPTSMQNDQISASGKIIFYFLYLDT